MATNYSRRHWLGWSAVGISAATFPATAWAVTKTPAMTEGPFYPRAQDLPLDQDNDLTTIAGKAGLAAGDLLDLSGRVIDGKGRPIRDALVEIWQCNSFGRYHDARDDSRAPRDPFFQGYGKFVTETEGRYRFRTIRPVAYPGRTPHIHIKVTSREYGVLTTQIFIAGEAGNARDGVLASLKTDEERRRVTMNLTSGAADSTAKWVGEFEIVLGAF